MLRKLFLCKDFDYIQYVAFSINLTTKALCVPGILHFYTKTGGKFHPHLYTRKGGTKWLCDFPKVSYTVRFQLSFGSLLGWCYFQRASWAIHPVLTQPGTFQLSYPAFFKPLGRFHWSSSRMACFSEEKSMWWWHKWDGAKSGSQGSFTFTREAPCVASAYSCSISWCIQLILILIIIECDLIWEFLCRYNDTFKGLIHFLPILWYLNVTSDVDVRK